MFIQGKVRNSRESSESFEQQKNFLAMESAKGKTRGEDFYNQVSSVIERIKIPWSKL